MDVFFEAGNSIWKNGNVSEFSKDYTEGRHKDSVFETAQTIKLEHFRQSCCSGGCGPAIVQQKAPNEKDPLPTEKAAQNSTVQV